MVVNQPIVLLMFISRVIFSLPWPSKLITIFSVSKDLVKLRPTAVTKISFTCVLYALCTDVNNFFVCSSVSENEIFFTCSLVVLKLPFALLVHFIFSPSCIVIQYCFSFTIWSLLEY